MGLGWESGVYPPQILDVLEVQRISGLDWPRIVGHPDGSARAPIEICNPLFPAHGHAVLSPSGARGDIEAVEVLVQSPFPFEALPRVWRWIERFRHKVADDFSPSTLNDFIAVQAVKWPHQRTWAIYADGELGGLVSFEFVNPITGTSHLLLKPDFQGKGIAVRALRQTFGEMFGLGIRRLVFYVYAGNLAVGSLIVNLGGKREGCLRSHTLQGGKPADVWIYGLLKEEFEAKRASTEGKVHELPVRIHENHEQQHDADADRFRPAALRSAS